MTVQQFVEYAPVAIAMFDRDMRYIAASRRWCEDYGLDVACLQGRSHYEVIPEISEEWKAVHRRCLEGATERADEDLFVRLDGRRQWIRWDAQPWRAEDGRIGGIIIFTEDITRRKEAEEALRRSEAKFRAIFQSLTEAVVFLDPEGNVVEANDAISDYGHSLEQLQNPVEDPRSRIVQPDGSLLPVAEQPAMVALRTGRAVRNVEIGVPTREGTISWRFVNAQPVYDDRQVLLGVIASFFDVTDIRRAEAVARETRSLLDAALASMADAVCISDTEGNLIEINDAFVTFHRFRSRDECPRRAADYREFLEVSTVNGDPVAVSEGATARALRGEAGMNAEFQLRRKDTGEVWVGSYNFAPIRNKDAAIVGAVVVGRDITQRLTAQRALQESEFRIRAVLNAAADAIITIDSKGTVVSVNPATGRMFGYTSDELVGRNVRMLMLDPERLKHDEYLKRFDAKVPRVIGGGRELSAVRKDGSVLDIELVVSPVGDLGLFTGIIRDITERKQTERELKRYQNNLRTMSLELVLTEERERQKLAQDLHDGLGQALFRARMKLDQTTTVGDKAFQEIGPILDAITKTATALTFELSPPVFRQLGLRPAIKWLARSMKQRYGLNVQVEDDGKATLVEERVAVLMFRSVRELLLNAIKHAKTDAVVVRVQHVQRYLRVEVEDRGQGFDMREQSGHTDSGHFGLFSIRERLQFLGGTFDLDSAPGRGTKVSLTAPVQLSSD